MLSSSSPRVRWGQEAFWWEDGITAVHIADPLLNFSSVNGTEFNWIKVAASDRLARERAELWGIWLWLLEIFYVQHIIVVINFPCYGTFFLFLINVHAGKLLLVYVL